MLLIFSAFMVEAGEGVNNHYTIQNFDLIL